MVKSNNYMPIMINKDMRRPIMIGKAIIYHGESLM